MTTYTVQRVLRVLCVICCGVGACTLHDVHAVVPAAPESHATATARGSVGTEAACAHQCWVIGPDLIEQIRFCLSNF